MFDSHKIIGNPAVGADDFATITTRGSRHLIGRIHAIGITYHVANALGVDVIVRTVGSGGPVLTLLTLTDNVVNGWFNVRHKVVDEAKANVYYEVTNAKAIYAPPIVDNAIEVVIDQADAGDSVDVQIIYDRGN